MLRRKESYVYILAGVVIVVCVVLGVAYALTEVYERTVSFMFPVFNVSLGALVASFIGLSVMWIRDKKNSEMR
jgi:diphthamide synthase (EF-2-diphthine--ammonia ligase)